MSQVEARAWWADVEHLRERIEGQDGPAAPRPRSASMQAPQRQARRTVVVAGRGAPVITARPLIQTEQRRQQPRTASRVADRPDRLAMWAVLLGLALMLVATSSAGAATSLGDRTLKAPMEGRDVRLLQSHLKDLGLLKASATAHYGPLTRRAVRRFQRSRCLTADGIAGPATIAAVSARMPRCAAPTHSTPPVGAEPLSPPVAGMLSRVVTWYGPGMYGRRTACGDRLTKTLVGVAHRTLPCGTKVRFVHDGRSVVARVVDRGPHTDGVSYDLTWAAAQAIGVLEHGRIAIQASK